MPPAPRLLPRSAPEPPHEQLPQGRWRARLEELLIAQVAELDSGEDDLGAVGELVFYPDRTWQGPTYVPATAPTANGFELFGYVRFVPDPAGEPSELVAHVD